MRIVPKGRLPRALEEYYRRLSYEEAVDSAWYAAGSAFEMGSLSAKAQRFHLDVIRRIEDSGDTKLAAQEIDSNKRLMCNWRAKGKMPFVLSDTSVHVSNSKQAEQLAPFIKLVSARIIRGLAELDRSGALAVSIADATYPTNKGKGAPHWAPGTNKEAAYALTALTMGCRTLDELRERCAKAGASFELLLTLYTRIQSAKKPRHRMMVDMEGKPVETQTLELLPKVRKVSGVPFVLNIAYGRLGKALLEASRHAGIGILPTIDEAIIRTRGVEKGALYATDFGNYDDTVAGETIALVAAHLTLPAVKYLYKRGFISRWEKDIVTETESYLLRAPILGPPQEYDTAAVIVDHYGGIVSGMRLTSIYGSVISNAFCRMTSERSKVTPPVLLTFGDDTILGFSSTRDQRRFAEWMGSQGGEIAGLKVEEAIDSTFLMRRMPQGYAYMGRMLISTLQKESTHEPRSMPIAALGMAARRLALRGHPNERDWEELTLSGELGPRVTAASVLAHDMGYNMSTLGSLVANNVGLSSSGGSTAHSRAEVAKTIRGASGSGYLEDSLADLVDELEGTNVKFTEIVETAKQKYYEGGEIAYPAVKDVLGV